MTFGKAQIHFTKLARIASFLGHPRMTLAYRTKPWVTPYLQRWHRKRLARQVNLEFLSKRPAGTFSPDFSDLWFLYQTVRRNKPRMVLEFGSGCSSVVIAQALADNIRQDPNQSGFLYSLDDQRRWADVTSASLPDALKKICEVWYVPTIEIDYDSFPCFRHSRLPDVVPDMVYLDGPTLVGQRKIAVDVLDIEAKLQPGFVLIIDGRYRNVEFLRTHLSRPFLFKHRIWYYNTVVTLTS